MSNENRMNILQAVDSKTKVMALIALIAEALFLGSLAALPASETLYALIACAVVLIVTLGGIVIIEVAEIRTKRAASVTDGRDSQSYSHLNIPENIRNEFRLSFLARRDGRSQKQRELLYFIEKHTAAGGNVSLEEIEERFKQNINCVYWRLENIMYLGFLEKVDAGEHVDSKSRFSYKLSSEYKKERASACV